MFTRLFSSRVQALCDAGAFTTPVTALLKNKQYALLYFGAAWAPGCQLFSPQLQTFRAEHAHAKKFEVLYISLDPTEEEFHAYLSQLQGEGDTGCPPVFPALAYEDALVQAPVLMGDFETTTILTVLVFEVREQKKKAASVSASSGLPSGGSFHSDTAPSASASSVTPRHIDAAETELVFRLVSRCGREQVECDPAGQAFPWAHAEGVEAEAAEQARKATQRWRGPMVAGVVALLSGAAIVSACRG